ncbi:hypothetical protein AURDEDRAFT_160540 [Auricularia subglabra TFB-10046 SS5]|nr:hypothetical protein AURDEDRAFT_160540 [Auricularia subglabra TFB-10046 SS5]
MQTRVSALERRLQPAVLRGAGDVQQVQRQAFHLYGKATHFDGLHGTYSFLTPDLLADPYHEHVVHRALARHLPVLVPEIEDEVMHAAADVLGLDDAQWRSVNLWDALQAVVARLSNRMFVGAPLCREERYFAANVGFADAVIRNMIVLTFVPRTLRPLFGPLLGLSNARRAARPRGSAGRD